MPYIRCGRRFSPDVQCFGRRGLHPSRELVVRDPRLQLGLVRVRLHMIAIQCLQVIQVIALRRAMQLSCALQVQDAQARADG